MEGITDEPYRLAIEKAFPEWDYYFTDFLRLPTQGKYKSDKILEHYGKDVLEKKSLKEKTGYQILTTTKAQTIDHVKRIEELGFEHLDLNLGCPSKKVNSHKGGAFLLSELDSLEKVIKDIRENFKGVFTAKIRVGYRNDELFEDVLHLLEDQGVEAVTIHGRTRDQMYEGRARWDYIKRAVEILSIPVIGNGDVWTMSDINQIFNETNCHAVMVARGALKTPWLATQYKEKKNFIDQVGEEELLVERRQYLENYFYYLLEEYKKTKPSEDALLRRFKAFSRYLFDDFDDPEVVRSRFLRSRTLDEFWGHLQRLL